MDPVPVADLLAAYKVNLAEVTRCVACGVRAERFSGLFGGCMSRSYPLDGGISELGSIPAFLAQLARDG